MPTLPNISPELIKKYQEEISKNSSEATFKRKTASLNKFFNWAEGSGHIDVSPMPAPPQNPGSDYLIAKNNKKNNVNLKTWAILGTTFGIIILIFLLTLRLGSPIEFVKNFAAGIENNPTAEVIINNQNVLPTGSPENVISASPAANPSWNLYANLKLTNDDGSPQVGSKTITFKVYNSENGGESLYTSDPQTVTTDDSGSSLISLDHVPTDLFFQNNKLFLEPVIGSASASTRIPVSTANVAANLGGYFPADPNSGAGELTIPVIDGNGSLNLASQSPAINGKSGNLLVQGQAVTIKAVDGGNGSIEINPDGKGIAHFLFEGSSGNFLNAQAPNLNKGSLYYGIVANNATGYDLLRLQNGSKAITRFSVDALGNTMATGNINAGGSLQTSGVGRVTSAGGLENITGYSQNSGNFVINQNPGNFASITKTGTALNNAVTMTLDERGATPNTSYSTLVLNRYNAYGTGMALLVANGNAQFDGILKLGNYTTNPGNIGTGSLVYNTTDNKVYVWNGTVWEAVGSSGTLAFSNITSGTNTTANMVVDSGASLSTSGTGTITATDVTCVGCVNNTELANSAITVNSSGILSGGGTVSLGGTLNLVATEADTLDSVTGRGATTANTLTVGNLIDNGLTANKTVFTDAAKQLTSTGTVGADQGGTGFSSYTVGDMLYADTTTTLAKLSDVATGNVLISGGTSTAPSWGKVVLGTHTTGNYVSTLTGTANQIDVSGSTGDITLTIPSDFRAPGTINAVNGIYTGATAGTERIDASGNLTNIGTTQLNTVTYTWPGADGSAGQVLSTNGTGGLSWAPTLTSDSIFWNQNGSAGVLFPKNNSVDVLIGSDSTTSAKFAFTGVSGGLPTASIAGTITNLAAYLTGNGNLAVTNMARLTLGGTTTSRVDVNNDLNLITGKEYQINGTSVLNATTLGTNVVTSSLTTVGALTSGSIANGFGTISTSNDINGSSLSTNSVARIDTSGNLTNIGTTQLHGITYTWPNADAGVAGYVLSSDAAGQLSWVDNGAGAVGTWTIDGAKGVIYPNSQTVDALIGGTATTSAKFAFTGVSDGIPTASIAGTTTNLATYLTGNGNLGVTNGAHLTLGGASTGQVDVSNNLNLASSKSYLINGTSVLNATTLGTNVVTSSLTTVGALASGSIANGFGTISTSNDINGSSLSTNSVARIDTSGNLTNIGTTQFNTITYTWPGSDASTPGYVLSSDGAGQLSWIANGSGAVGTWTIDGAKGVIYPNSQTVDALIGGTATSSAKFAFTGVSSGLPTASIAGNLANVATYLTGNGNLATTNAQNLTLGGTETGNVVINSRGSAALTANGSDLTTVGTFTLPNTNSLTGAVNYLQLSHGVSVGGATTYHFDSSGNINAAGITGTSITDTGLTANKPVFTDGSKNLTSLGTLLADQGGTGFSSYTVGDMLYADTTTTLAKLSDVATGNVLISGGTSTAPSWGKVVLGTHTTGNYVSTLTGTANQIDVSGSTGDITLTIPSDFRAPGTINAVNGIYTGATAGTERIDASGNLTNIGTTQLHGITYTWPNADAGVAGYVLSSDAAGQLSWVDKSAGAVGTWTIDGAKGVIYPNSQTVDALIGGTATTSAKFAFTGVISGGLPTASISGNLANVATYLTGNGNLATTNARDLTLGSSTTGQVIINSRGTSSIIADGSSVTVAGDLNSSAATAALFNATTTNLSIGGAATTFNIGPAGSGASSIFLSGGSSDTGCTVDGATGDFSCSGNLSGAGTTGLTLSGAGAGITFSGANTHAIAVSTAATDLTIDAGTTGIVNIGGTSTGNILLGGGSASTGCTLTNSTGDLICAGQGTFGGALQAGTITTPTAYSRIVDSSATVTGHGFTTAQDVLIGGNMELDGVLYLDGRIISNPNGTATIVFAANPSAINNPNILDNGVWWINNNVNDGMAALMVNQAKGADIFSASASGATKFTIHNDGSITLAGMASTTNTAEGTVYYDTDVDHLYLMTGDAAFHRIALDMTKYSVTNASVANGSYVEIAHNQNTNDITLTAWVKDTITGLWKKITDVASTIVHNLDNLFNPSYAQKTKVNSVALALSENTGDGADGAITVGANTNINTTAIATGRSGICSDASQQGDAVNYSVTALTSTSATVTPTPSTGCLSAGDEILLINLQGTNSAYGNVGNYEFLEVSSIAGSTVNFKTSKTKHYGDNTSDDTNLGTTYGTQRVMLQRVPNYTTVSVSSGYALYPSAWNGAKGGVIAFRATGEVSVVGYLQATSTAGGGYAAGAAATVSLNGGAGGEAFCGAGGVGDSPGNGGAGAAGGGTYYTGAYVGGPAYCGGGGGGHTGGTGSASAGGSGGGGSGYQGAGGGGGYGTYGSGGYGAANGGNGGTNSSGNGGSYDSPGAGGGGGGSYGTTDLSKLYFGSGGGGAGLHGSYPPAGAGGMGGGIIYVSAATINVSGLVSANGNSGGNGNNTNGAGGGGGAGGSIRLAANTISLGTNKVQASGGSGGTGGYSGGAGGTGVIATYSNTTSGSISSAYGVYNSYSLNYFPYSVYVSKEIHTPATTAFNNISWTESLDTNGLVSVQTRSGNTSDSKDGTWEAWKPATTDTNIKVLQSADTHTDWVGSVDSSILTKYNNTSPTASDTTGTDGRIPLGTSGTGDDVQTFPTSVIKDGSTYKMWYSGNDSSTYRIYLATSSDGLTWTKSSNTIPTTCNSGSACSYGNGRLGLGTNGTGDDTHAGFNSVILDGSTYKMWYSGHDGSNWRIYYATSSDGLTWTKYDNSTPGSTCDDTGGACNTNGRMFLGSAGKGDDEGAYRPSVVKDGSTYKMWYIGSHGGYERTYYATSSDGLSWTKLDNDIEANSDTTGTNGRIPLGTNGTGDDTWASAPSVVFDGSTYKMWYIGHDGATFRIYQATSSDGLTWTKTNNAIPATSDTSSSYGKVPLGSAGKGDSANVGYQGVIKDGTSYKLWYGGSAGGSNYTTYYAYTSTVNASEGDITRNVNYYEDEDEATAGNITKLSSVGTSGYVEATIASTDISSYDMISAWVYSVTPGSVVKLGFGEAAGNEQEETVTIDQASAWQKVYWNIKDVASDSRDAVTKLRVSLTSTNNTVYIDNIKAEKLLTTAASSAITSTANNYIQYRAVMSTTNIQNKPTASSFLVNLTNANGTYNVDASSTYTQTDAADMYSSGRNSIGTSDLDDIKSNRTSVALTSVTQAGSYNPGTGKDGAIVVSGGININTTPISANRTSICTDAGQQGDAVRYSVTSLTSTTATVSPTPSTGCLVAGDEILLINLQGDYTSTINTGNYETLEIASISNNVITFKTAKTKFYGENNNDDTNIGTAYGTQRVMLQRVPNYTDVTINSASTLYNAAWNGTTGGVMFFRASGTVNIVGTISVNGTGYLGGAASSASMYGGFGGEAFCGAGGTGNSVNGGSGAAGGGTYYTSGTGGAGYCGGGGGGVTGGAGSASAGGSGAGGSGYQGAGGGGGYGTYGSGGNGTAGGGNGGTNSSGNGGSYSSPGAGGGGGGSYGTTDLSKLYFGSGGGGAGLHGDYPPAGAGGNGGGILYISANTVNVSGSVTSAGASGTSGHSINGGGGGGGAGGSVRIEGNTLNLGTSKVTAASGSGGVGGYSGGAGGSGRIAVYYTSSYSGTTSPTANIASYPTYPYSVLVSDEIPTPNATELQKLSWTADLNSYGKVAFQTRSGKSSNATDGTWEAWKPAVADTNIKILESADTHTNWVSGSSPNDVAVADGGVARNVNEYEDEDEATTGNMTKLSSVGTATGYAEATIASTNLSSYDYLSAWVYSTSSGNVVKLGLGETAGNEQEETVTIDATNTWQKVYWDLSDIPWDSRNTVTKLRTTLLSTNNTVYIDNFKAEKIMTDSAGTQISSTPNDYIQYRMILSTTNTTYRPKVYNVKVEWNNGYKIIQTDANTVRLYNSTGSTQEIRLDAIVFGADLAEYYAVNDQSIESADVVAVTGNLDDYGVPVLRKSSSVNDSGLIGIISTKAGQTLGIEAEDRRLLALAGRVPVKIATGSATIKYGDPITSSSEPGRAKKASLGEKSVGTALESWSPDAGKDRITVLVGNGNFLTPVLSDLNAYTLNAKVNATEISYELTDSLGETVNNIGIYSQMLVANIKAGLITTSNLIAQKIQTPIISPLPDGTDVTVQIGSIATPSGKFAIQNSEGTEVASIDNMGNATFSGIVRSKNIDEIQALLTQVQTDQFTLLAATSAAELTASGSANIAELITNNMYVTGQATLTSASIADSLTLGSDLVFGLGGNTINSLSTPLQIQSLAMAPVEIMGGLITIDTQGNMQITGNLYVAGKITTSELDTGTINATGSATLNSVTTPELIVAASDATVSGTIVDGVITTNSMIGQAVIPAGTSEITVRNSKVTDYTLVYVTPTSPTQNNVLYVKSKSAGQFVVGFTNAIDTDTNFNWWIVQIQN